MLKLSFSVGFNSPISRPSFILQSTLSCDQLTWRGLRATPIRVQASAIQATSNVDHKKRGLV